MDEEDAEPAGAFSPTEQPSDRLQLLGVVDLSDDQQMSVDSSNPSDDSFRDSEIETGSDDNAAENEDWVEDGNGGIPRYSEQGKHRTDSIAERNIVKRKKEKSRKSAPSRLRRKINSTHGTNDDSAQKNSPAESSEFSKDGQLKGIQKSDSFAPKGDSCVAMLQRQASHAVSGRTAGRIVLKPLKRHKKARKGKDKASTRKRPLEDSAKKGLNVDEGRDDRDAGEGRDDIDDDEGRGDRDGGVISPDYPRRSPVRSPLFQTSVPRMKQSWTRCVEEDFHHKEAAIKRVASSADHQKRRPPHTEAPDDSVTENRFRSRSCKSLRKQQPASCRDSDVGKQNSSQNSSHRNDPGKGRSSGLAGGNTGTRECSRRLRECNDRQKRKDEERKRADNRLASGIQLGCRASSTVPPSRQTVSAGSAFANPSPSVKDLASTDVMSYKTNVGEYKSHPHILPETRSDLMAGAGVTSYKTNVGESHILPETRSERNTLARPSTLPRPRTAYSRVCSTREWSRSVRNGSTLPDPGPPAGTPQLPRIKTNAWSRVMPSSANTDPKARAAGGSSDIQPLRGESGPRRPSAQTRERSMLSATLARSLMDSNQNAPEDSNQNALEKKSDENSDDGNEGEQTAEESQKQESGETSRGVPLPDTSKHSRTERLAGATRAGTTHSAPKRKGGTTASHQKHTASRKLTKPRTTSRTSSGHSYHGPKKKGTISQASEAGIRTRTPETGIGAGAGSEPAGDGVSGGGSQSGTDTHGQEESGRKSSDDRPKQSEATTSHSQEYVHLEQDQDQEQKQDQEQEQEQEQEQKQDQEQKQEHDQEQKQEQEQEQKQKQDQDQEQDQDQDQDQEQEQEQEQEQDQDQDQEQEQEQDQDQDQEQEQEQVKVEAEVEDDEVGETQQEEHVSTTEASPESDSYSSHEEEDENSEVPGFTTERTPDFETEIQTETSLPSSERSRTDLSSGASEDEGSAQSEVERQDSVVHLVADPSLEDSSSVPAAVPEAELEVKESRSISNSKPEMPSKSEGEKSTSLIGGSQLRLPSIRSLFELSSGSTSNSYNHESYDAFPAEPEDLHPCISITHKVKSKPSLRIWTDRQDSLFARSGFILAGKSRESFDRRRDTERSDILYQVRYWTHRRKRELNRKRWLNALRLVCDVCYIAKTMSIRSYGLIRDCPTFMDVGDYTIGIFKTQDGSYTDTELFKVCDLTGVFKLSPEVRMTLLSRPEERSRQEVSQVLYSLQNIESFCSYPLRTQQLIGRHAYYTQYGANRVLMRQFHAPVYYYLILCGQVLVSQAEESENGPCRYTRAVLSSGQAFGDHAILNKSTRTATVTTHTEVQLLLVPKDNFISIFIPEQLTDGVPGYIKYLSTCAWLQGWPWRKFLDNPGQCYTHYFRRRQVIVADSEASDNIYVVRHGSCQVLMLIDGLKGSWKDVEDTVLKEFFLLNQRMGIKLQDNTWEKVRPRRRPVSASDIQVRVTPQPQRNSPRRTPYPDTRPPQTASQEASSETLQPSVVVTLHPSMEDTLRTVSRSDNDPSTGSRVNESSSAGVGHLGVRCGSSELGVDRNNSAVVGQSHRGSSTAGVIVENTRVASSCRVCERAPYLASSSGVIQKDQSLTSSSGVIQKDQSLASSSGVIQNDPSLASSSLVLEKYQYQAASSDVNGKDPRVAFSSGVSEKDQYLASSSDFSGKDPRVTSSSGVYGPSVDTLNPCATSSTYSSWESTPSRSLPSAPPCRRPPHDNDRQDKEKLSTWARRQQYQVPRKCRPRRRPQTAPARTDKKIFVQLQVLTEGDVFGLDQIEMEYCQRPKSHKVSLVSDGAEVIAINKKFLALHANADMQQALHLYAGPGYPSPEQVHHVCQLQMAWELYKDKMKDEFEGYVQDEQKRCHYGLYFQPGPLIHPLASIGLTTDTR